MSNTIKSILSDPDGNLSTMRVLTMTYVLIVGVTWMLISVKEGYMIDLDPQVKELLLYLLGFKTVQRFSEAIPKKIGSVTTSQQNPTV